MSESPGTPFPDEMLREVAELISDTIAFSAARYATENMAGFMAYLAKVHAGSAWEPDEPMVRACLDMFAGKTASQNIGGALALYAQLPPPEAGEPS